MARPLETEVFIAGGGPAGLAVAIAARRAGFEVLVADLARPPIDKACGEGIMPDGLAALHELGVDIPLEISVPFRGIRFVDGAGTVAAGFSYGTGRGIRRRRLHELLLGSAERLGVAAMWGSRVSATRSTGDSEPLRVTVDGRDVRAHWIIGADGASSRLAAAAGLHDAPPRLQRIGFRKHYRVKPWSSHVEVHWSDRGQLYVTPTASDEVCVAFITSRKELRLPDALPSFPVAQRRLAGARSLEAPLGAVTTTRKLRSVFRGNLALAGDASGSVDAVTGEGLAMAFRQATALVAAMCRGELTSYQHAHDEIMQRPLAMARLMLLMDNHPRLRHRAFRTLAAAPHLFEQMLAVHVGALSPLDLGVRNAATFAWRLISAA
jgi:flavin-dependent dehydrogenase